MTTVRRIGAEDSATRHALLDAAQRLMLDEGYASVTSRRVAATAGLKPQLVHYYFRTMDDLFVALVRRGAEQNLARQTRALEARDAMNALWEFCSDPAGARLNMEFSALANHRKAIRSELATYARQFRTLQTDALAAILTRSGVTTTDVTPAALAVIITAISQIVAMEAALGVTSGHDETRKLVAAYISRVDSARNQQIGR